MRRRVYRRDHSFSEESVDLLQRHLSWRGVICVEEIMPRDRRETLGALKSRSSSQSPSTTYTSTSLVVTSPAVFDSYRFSFLEES
ncbi:hypothetical protein CSUI_008227 [Cystoisospora suis]|uniref:Uncharacterized protein n=1 Tax=Cystoisospora suis TaxID=483139 RepID=A0A2C6KLE2_9APIC|nr:hypothetical protein CSUI_008227 [Cystoisospora suis]